MKAEDKAKEFIDKYGIETALKIIDEIIKSNPTYYLEEIKEDIGYIQYRECALDYWQEVKQEVKQEINKQ